MKFTCQSALLRQEIEYAYLFAGQKNSLSISSNVLLEAANESLTVKTTDQKTGFISIINVNVVLPGSTTVSCEYLLSALKWLSQGEVEISDETGKLMIYDLSTKSSSPDVVLSTISSDKFPQLRTAEEDSYFAVPQRDIFDMVEKTSFAVSDDDTRFFLCGVYMEKRDGKLVMVATDGKRLAMVKRQFEQEIPDFPGAIIPVKFLSNMERIGTGEGLLSLSIDEGCIFVRIGSRTFYTLLITGKEYPNYNRVIPQNLANSCVLKAKDLDNALSFSSVFVENKSRKVLLLLEDGKITVVGESDAGSSKRELDCVTDDASLTDGPGKTLSITFNCSVFQMPVKKVSSEFLRIKYNTPKAAMLVTPEPESDYFFVVMPMMS